jgi:hypothetical protein
VKARAHPTAAELMTRVYPRVGHNVPWRLLAKRVRLPRSTFVSILQVFQQLSINNAQYLTTV